MATQPSVLGPVVEIITLLFKHEITRGRMDRAGGNLRVRRKLVRKTFRLASIGAGSVFNFLIVGSRKKPPGFHSAQLSLPPVRLLLKLGRYW